MKKVRLWIALFSLFFWNKFRTTIAGDALLMGMIVLGALLPHIVGSHSVWWWLVSYVVWTIMFAGISSARHAYGELKATIKVRKQGWKLTGVHLHKNEVTMSINQEDLPK